MKKYFILFMIFFILILSFNCKKEKETVDSNENNISENKTELKTYQSQYGFTLTYLDDGKIIINEPEKISEGCYRENIIEGKHFGGNFVVTIYDLNESSEQSKLSLEEYSNSFYNNIVKNYNTENESFHSELSEIIFEDQNAFSFSVQDVNSPAINYICVDFNGKRYLIENFAFSALQTEKGFQFTENNIEKIKIEKEKIIPETSLSKDDKGMNIFSCGLGFSIVYPDNAGQRVENLGLQNDGYFEFKYYKDTEYNKNTEEAGAILEVYDPETNIENAIEVSRKDLKEYVEEYYNLTNSYEKNSEIKEISFQNQIAYRYTAVSDYSPSRDYIIFDYNNKRFIIESIEQWGEHEIVNGFKLNN